MATPGEATMLVVASVVLALAMLWMVRHMPYKHPLKRHVLLLVLAIAALVITRYIVVLTAQRFMTGSMLEREYEWYGLEATGTRLFPDRVPRNNSAECLPASELGQPPHAPSMKTTVDPALVQPHNGRIRVHVLNLDDDQFSFVWNSILADGIEDEPLKVHDHQGVLLAKLPRRSFPDLGIEMVLVDSNERFDLLSRNGSSRGNVLVFGSHGDGPFLFQLLHGWKVGFIFRGTEQCRMPSKETLTSEHSTFQFGYISYGDCTMIDNKRFFSWPLGPSAYHGFPPKIDESMLLPANKRPFILNLMVTHTTRKPTRMQAKMVADDICVRLGTRQCLLSQTNFLFKAVEFLELELLPLGTSFRYFFTSEKYKETLLKSKLTLCPSGNTPEQYRIWEAIIAGSIPVVEDPPFVQGRSLHPAFGEFYGCEHDDVHRLLKETNAPVFYVKDWRQDLPGIIREIEDSEALLARQRDLIRWFSRFRTHLRVTLLESILKTMR